MSYTSSSIKVLKGLQACRTRPGMYIGNIEDGVFQMLKEVLDNSIDEHLANHCNEIFITIKKDGYAVVEDNGRGIPVDIHEEEGVSAAILIMTQLHAGGKFDQNSYKVSGGLHGVGVSVVNALSDTLKMNIFKDGFEYYAEFAKGDIVQDITKLGPTNKHGTRIEFIPDPTILPDITFNLNQIEKRLDEISYLNPGLKINLIHEESESKKTFFQPKGISAFVEKLLKTNKPLHDLINFDYEEGSLKVVGSLVWSSSYSEEIRCFTNNIPQADGGTHLIGLKTGLTRCIQNYLQKDQQLQKKMKDIQLTGEDIREGIVCAISLYMPEPQFASQTKEKLVSAHIRSFVEKGLTQALEAWLEENPAEVKEVVEKIANAAFAREAARKSRDLVRNNKNSNDLNIGLAKKLYGCSEKDPTKTELFLVEGQSGGGTVKYARDRTYQAVLPLRGKILNVEKAGFNKMLTDESIRTLIAVMGTGIGENFDITRIKYNKIIIMTDADVDGSHILTLLVTFFFKHMRPVIENGYLYVAQPPLYGVRQGSKINYLLDDEKLAEFLFERNVEKINFKKANELIEKEIVRDFIKDLWNIGKELKNRSVLYQAFIIAKFEDPEEYSYEKMLEILKKLNVNGQWHYENEKFIYEFNGLTYKYSITPEKVSAKYYIFIRKWSAFWAGDIEFTYDSQAGIFNNPYDIYQLLEQKGSSGLTISRFKGLGEMEVEDLANTAMKDYKRIVYENEQEAEDLINKLMGEDVCARKEFILNLDPIETDG